MLRAFCSTLLIVVIASARTTAQEAEIPWLSLKRLSVTASAAYHYNPWKKYNESMTLAQDAVRYDSYYQNPSGRFEKILGDASFDLSFGYRILLGLSVNLRVGFLTTGSSSDVSYNKAFTSYAVTSPVKQRETISQKMQLSVPHYGIELQYTHSVTDRVSIAASTSVSRYLASLSFENRHNYTALWRELYTAELSERKYGVTCMLDVAYKTYGSLSVTASVDYRLLKFAGLSGNGTYVTGEPSSGYSSGYSHSFEAHLGEANGYYGIIMPENDQIDSNVYGLYRLWARAPVPPVYTNQRPAILDLSGVGVSVGIRYEL